ncbi:hypothetical protein DL546_008702 [Coniochaeta pulveracea]|nr:hypothetical protein DL546_008702 [Coniochaeta pulveracea]
MSIGFSVPIVMLARHSVAPGDTIARIIACFIIAGILSAVLVYVLATATQHLLELGIRRISNYQRDVRPTDEEAAYTMDEAQTNKCRLSVIMGKSSKYSSQVSSVVSFQDPRQSSNGYNSSSEGRDNVSSPTSNSSKKIVLNKSDTSHSRSRRLKNWILHNLFLTLSWTSTILITIPLRHTRDMEIPLGISLLLSLWTSFLTLQAAIKTTNSAILRPKLRTVLSVLCNPVLWTALGLLAYTSAESHRTNRPVATVLSTLEQNTTFTDLIMHRPRTPIPYHSRPIPSIAAGDVANAILSSGLVCWGLKLWEHRRRLLSSAGFTILLVSCMAALVNVIAGPLLAREVLGPRSQAGYDLAFVARSVTLALGAPAVSRLGGDVGLNAAMVVVNGILYQMALGLGFGGWVARRVKDLAEWLRRVGRGRQEEEGTVGGVGGEKTMVTDGGGRTALIGTSGVLGAAGRLGVPDHLLRPREGTTLGEASPSQTRATIEILDDNKTTSISTIAAGVTIGINAAAMGTAHLYESNSDAAPYAALAMTAFGVATVGFTMVPQLGGWIASMVQ